MDKGGIGEERQTESAGVNVSRKGKTCEEEKEAQTKRQEDE
jgi:hypothetical protein